MPRFAPEHQSSNYRILGDEVALDGSNPTVIVTGFEKIEAVHLTLQGATTPGDGTRVLTYAIDGGTVNVYAWKSATDDPTLEASGGTDTFSYIIVGR